MNPKKQAQYKTVQLSTETYELLCKLQADVEEIFRKKKISMDQIIHWLIVSKVDWTDLALLRKSKQKGRPSSKPYKPLKVSL